MEGGPRKGTARAPRGAHGIPSSAGGHGPLPRARCGQWWRPARIT
jgi:hypothetical protein